MSVPKFVIKNSMNKSSSTGIYFKDIIAESDLEKICYNLTGKFEYSVDFVENDYEDDFLERSYNKGRLGILHYQNNVYYICFSDNSNSGRNSSLQSVSTAFNKFYVNKHPEKELVFYFLPSLSNYATNYHIFMYRLMATAGFKFINTPKELVNSLQPFTSIDDIILSRKANSERNKGNNATYILKNNPHVYEVYGKTFGANKYETSLICYAISAIALETDKITLFQYNEKDLKQLPKSSLAVLSLMGNINVVNIDDELEKQELRKNNSIRSPRFNARLLNHLGDKKCVICECEISEIIQGAHIWPVAEIKKHAHLTIEQQLSYATDAENGLWMCQNHHKLFDSNIIRLTESGQVKYDPDLPDSYRNYIDSVTLSLTLPHEIVTKQFQYFIKMRNENIHD
ncbi:TPA: HNH endonuclease [Streptococcus suis]|nr:HNH endonuclease [Streptococcus suis]